MQLNELVQQGGDRQKVGALMNVVQVTLQRKADPRCNKCRFY